MAEPTENEITFRRLRVQVMRILLLSSIVLSLCSTAFAKTTARTTRKAVRKPDISLQAKPLSPAELKGKVVYVLNRDVWAINPQTRQKFLLYKDLFFPTNESMGKYLKSFPFTYPVGVDFEVSWSLDRTHVAFVYRDGIAEGSELFVMNWNGSGKRQVSLGNYESIISNPRWSPDGKLILYDERGLYREGGPGFDYARIGIASVNGELPKFSVGKSEGTTSNPFWSRDGRKILFSSSLESADYITSETPSGRKVVSLDGSAEVDFNGNWKDFLIDNQSQNGEWRVERNSAEAYWMLYQSDILIREAVVWQEYQGFQATNFCPSNNGKQFIFDGGFTVWQIDAQGITTPTPFLGIWSTHLETGYVPAPRLLVKGGQLVNWFDDSK